MVNPAIPPPSLSSVQIDMPPDAALSTQRAFIAQKPHFFGRRVSAIDAFMGCIAIATLAWAIYSLVKSDWGTFLEFGLMGSAVAKGWWDGRELRDYKDIVDAAAIDRQVAQHVNAVITNRKQLLADIAKDATTLQKTTKDQKDNLKAEKQTTAALQQRRQDLARAQKALQRQVDTIEGLLSTFSQELQQQGIHSAQAQAILVPIQNAVRQLEATAGTLTVCVNSLDQGLATLSSTGTALQQELDRGTAEVTQLQGTTNIIGQDEQALAATNQQFNAGISRLDTSEAQIRSDSTRAVTLQQHVAAVNGAVDKLIASLPQLQAANTPPDHFGSILASIQNSMRQLAPFVKNTPPQSPGQ